MSSTQQDDSYDVNSSRSPEPEQGGAANRFQPSVKLMEKMERIAEWRIDPSLIEFPQDATEVQGGHATVSRALLKVPSDNSDTMDEFDARNEAGQKVVAVKKLKRAADQDLERVLGLALREAGLLVELSYGHIIKLEGFVEDVSRGTIWLVFPWEANGNLRDFVASRDWDIPERISLINDVAYGVEYLHSHNPPICHGDLKSVNILVNSDCRAVITDFGSARRLTEDDLNTKAELAEGEQQPATRLEATFSTSTNTVTLTGGEFTLRWAAPELLKDDPTTVKVDIWALGWIAYEVMTNSLPFENVVKDSIVIRKITQGDLPSITDDARMSLMLQLCCLMSECWSSGPTQRPTAMNCRKSLRWMQKIVPDPSRNPESTAPEARSPLLLLKLGNMHQTQGDYANASKFYTEALRISTDSADKEGQANATLLLGCLHQLHGREEEALVLYSDAQEIYTSIGDKRLKAGALIARAQAYTLLGMVSEAATLYSDALIIYTNISNSYGTAYAMSGLAGVHMLQGEYGHAIALYTEALQVWTDIGSRFGRAGVLRDLAEVHRYQHEYDEAIKFGSDALQIYTDMGETRGRAAVLAGLALVSHDQGLLKDAIDLYEQASNIWEQIGDYDQAALVSKCAASARQQVELLENTA